MMDDRRRRRRRRRRPVRAARPAGAKPAAAKSIEFIILLPSLLWPVHTVRGRRRRCWCWCFHWRRLSLVWNWLASWPGQRGAWARISRPARPASAAAIADLVVVVTRPRFAFDCAELRSRMPPPKGSLRTTRAFGSSVRQLSDVGRA